MPCRMHLPGQEVGVARIHIDSRSQAGGAGLVHMCKKRVVIGRAIFMKWQQQGRNPLDFAVRDDRFHVAEIL